jgi:hypothetical protein
MIAYMTRPPAMLMMLMMLMMMMSIGIGAVE